ncbi:hypothetical protein VPR01S_01_00410 [Vibrio proteolyticus NBRC 13287]|uniref:FIST C-domain domain-containing protein n=2 Tax=Vibrio proteolyticus TaxID=671 RepID=U3B5Y2_VIBPR|nr:hypothetical protein VPR01S_01_00410 [Vibrio proteolyticus NBRC 13287]
MHFKTRVSHKPQESMVADDMLSELDVENLASVICYYTQDYDPSKLRMELSKRLPDHVPVIGASTCRGLMTEKGLHWGPVVGLAAIYDSKSSAYGSALSQVYDDSDIPDLVSVTLDRALKKAEREGEVPGFVIAHATPGFEEKIIDAIDSKFHVPVPIIGGSAADNGIKGHWSIFTEKAHTTRGIALQVFFPSEKLSTNFSAGYSPTEFTGTVTKAKGRELLEIDGEPAQKIYREWISDHAGVSVPPHFVFELVTQYPLGRIAGHVYAQPYYKLSHPIRISQKQGLLLFTDIRPGDAITLMSGDREQLISRGARVLQEANRKNHLNSHTLGILCIMCAGPMLYLGEDMKRVYANLKHEAANTPFICPFTFGEQGRFAGGENGHGNLMISAARFYRSR